MNATKSLQMFLEEHKVQIEEATPVETNPHMEGPDMNHWKLVLVGMFHNGAKRTMTTHFSMGAAHADRQPEVMEVFECLLSDARGVEDTSFEDWAEEHGLDTDSRKAERTYNACRTNAAQLKVFLDETYREAMDLEID